MINNRDYDFCHNRAAVRTYYEHTVGVIFQMYDVFFLKKPQVLVSSWIPVGRNNKNPAWCEMGSSVFRQVVKSEGKPEMWEWPRGDRKPSSGRRSVCVEPDPSPKRRHWRLDGAQVCTGAAGECPGKKSVSVFNRSSVAWQTNLLHRHKDENELRFLLFLRIFSPFLYSFFSLCSFCSSCVF